MPVLLNSPTQPVLAGCRFSACAPAAVLFSVPALVNTGFTPVTIPTGIGLVLVMLNTPPAWFTNVGVRLLKAENENQSRSSPPSVTVPALSQRWLSWMAKSAPVALRSMLVVEPAGVMSVPLPRRLAAVPLAVKLPVTVSVALPPSTGLVPVSVSSASEDTAGATRFSVAPLTVRLAGSDSKPLGAFRFSVPPVRDSAGSARLPPALTLKVPPDTVIGSKVAGALSSSSVSVPPLTVSPVPPAGLDAAASVRVPPLNSKVAPAAIA